ncbi:MAG: OmpA family protein [Bacteroidales bacterium]|nr:OmpA family protein [Bacteroidales bacterium]
MKRAFILLIMIMVLPMVLFSQKRKAERAYEAYRAGEYYEAIDYFKDAYTKSKDREVKAELVVMVAECYRIINDSRNAETWYRRAVRTQGVTPEAQYWLAETLKKNEKYQLAIDEYRKYRQAVANDPRADLGIRSCELALEWMKNPEAYTIEEMKDINSRETDFGPAFARDDHSMIYFTSSRADAAGNKKHGATGQGFTDIFETRLDKKGKWSVPVPLTIINTEAEEGTPSVSFDYRELYFTRCDVGKREEKGCVIMYAEKSGADWGAPKSLSIFSDSLVAAHPAISPDGLTLWFVSDIPGGYGGKDIYYVTRPSVGDSWSRPVNMGPDVNTRGNELFPFMREDGTLYFSSDGHIGMGGLDIFRAIPQPDGKWIVNNMRPPLNSSADDFGIVYERGAEKGLFSSTRKGRGNDEIYSFEMPPLTFSIRGLVKDEKTGAPVASSVVQLIASDGTNLQASTGNNGDFSFSLRPDVDYIFLASKEGYLNGKARETTRGQEKSREFLATILMTPIDKPIELPNIFYDFGKWDLRPESMVSLDKLTETLNDNPNITIELMSHTDSRDTEEFNLTLSQRRAQSVVDYLIEKGIEPERLSPVGYGESSPKVVDSEIASLYNFLREGTVLSEQFINGLPTEEEKEIAHQINRRTEFRVLRTDYK